MVLRRIAASVSIWLIVILGVFCTYPFPGPRSAEAARELAVYTAPDGFRVVSYAGAWADTQKLRQVYQELLKNGHGEEFKLLRRINIYPGPDPEGGWAAGKWFGVWETVKGQPRLMGNRYIDIYNGQKLTSVESISRTLAHEYGHHFTYYYYFKKEKKTWEKWRTTGLAAARGLQGNHQVKDNGSEHEWLIQEIAAEDYVQLFGSPTARKSQQFRDIGDRLNSSQTGTTYDTNIFNYCPQENQELPLAHNVPGIRNYWAGASGLRVTGSPPSQVSLRLEEVNRIEGVSTPQYVFGWDKAQDDTTARLEYTLVWYYRHRTAPGQSLTGVPVRTVYDDEPLRAVLGAAKNSSMYMWEEVPEGNAYFVVHVKDAHNMITSSSLLAIDFSNPWEPQTVIVDDLARISGKWFPPRVKVNNKQLVFDVPPVIQNGRTLVPLRAIFEELGAMVDWDAGTKTIAAEKDGNTITMEIGNTKAMVNGLEVMLEAPPQIFNSRTLVPLRFVSEALGAEVAWNQALSLALVKKDI